MEHPENVFDFIVKIDDALPHIEATLSRLYARERIPSGARVVAASQARIADLIEIQQTSYGDKYEDITRHYGNDKTSLTYDLEKSYVVFDRTRPVGIFMTLDEISPRKRFIYLVAVIEGYRRGWANVLLKHKALTDLKRQGVVSVGFRPATGTIDALKHATRSGASKLDYHQL